jgi:hypothetical protein
MNQIPQASTAERDRETTEYLYATLRTLPNEIGGTEALIASYINERREAAQRLDDAELNASLSAETKGTNADSRKLELKAAISKNPDYIAARQEVNTLDSLIEIQNAEATGQRRTFQAAIALTELHAARINMMTKIQTTKEVTK